ncbi:MAG: DUF3034 family protein [Prolixibacteraceae bacterium]|nr:DUF3034 family protein [Burkholderiales bacterium]
MKQLPIVLVLFAQLAFADILPQPGGRLIATGGVTQIEGTGGGGLVPWALISGYGTRDQVGMTAFYTQADPSDFRLHSAGVAVGIRDRVEISLAQQRLGLGSTVPGQSIDQTLLGIKLKVLGDAVFDQDRWWPQVALGAIYKHNEDMAVPRLLGAKRDADTDFYVSATKVYLAAVFGRNLLLNATLRATRANQLGLLGFGGDKNDRYQAMGEVSAGVFLCDRVLLGAEYRQKPDNLSAFQEQDFHDFFIAFVPNKHLSMTAAYVNLGQIADKNDQEAFYVSVQLAF